MKKLRLFVLNFFAVISITANAVIDSGTCGDNITWTLDDDYSLTLTGSGAMTNYSYGNIPWISNRESIIKVTIDDGITSIGNYAFSGCSGLSSVVIPNSVTSIGDNAFEGCSSLTSLTIPNSVTSIGNAAFYMCMDLLSITLSNTLKSIGGSTFAHCYNLLAVNIPETVESIGGAAFYLCEGIPSIIIPKSVKTIGEHAFMSCTGIVSLKVDENNEYFCSQDNVLFNKDKTELLFCIQTKSGAYIIPNTVTKIDAFAFCECKGLTSVNIPNSVTSIGDNAFSNCNNLISCNLPNKITRIGDNTFYGCSKLNSLTIPNSMESIGEMAFYGCTELQLENAFPETMKRIERYAFGNCKNIKTLMFNKNIEFVHGFAFKGCNNIRTLHWNNTLSNCFDLFIEEMYYGDDINIIFPTISSETKLLLKKVVIGKNVEYIRQETFFNATNLREFYITGEKDIYLYPNVFQNANLSGATLYVPKSKAEYYKNTSPWCDFGKILTLEGTEFDETDVAINDNCSEFTHSQENCKELTYTRNFSNTSWQSLYVPFSMSYDDWKDDFEVAYINDVRQYDDNEDGIADRTEVEVFKMKEGKSINPNTPYLIKAKTTGEKTITLEDATLYQTQENTYDVTSWFTRFNFIGTYHTISNMASNGYYAMSDGTLKKATSDAATLQPFRWYLSVTDRNGNPVSLNSKSMSIVFDDGEATGIENVNNEAKVNSSIHTLTGISKGNDMKSLAPGIYIKNGKKFIVK